MVDNQKSLFILIDCIDIPILRNQSIVPDTVNTMYLDETFFPFKKVNFREEQTIVIRFLKGDIDGMLVKIKSIKHINNNSINVSFFPLYYIKISKRFPYNDYEKVMIKKIEFIPIKNKIRENSLKEILRERVLEFLKMNVEYYNPDNEFTLHSTNDLFHLGEIVLSIIPFDIDIIRTIMSKIDVKERINEMLVFLEEKLIILREKQKIANLVKKSIEKNQKRYFLNEQLKIIKKELGFSENIIDESNELKNAIKRAKMPEHVLEKAYYELNRLSTMNPSSPEATVIRNYLDWLINIPWYKKTEDNLDIGLAEKILNKNHYGLTKVKERVLEFLAVMKLSKHSKGQILCFVGPPGVGKTSLGLSISHSIGREFVRISLGGVKDEAEIRGHRKTYIGSLPGKILQMMRRAKVINPVFMLDEVDKLGSDFRGDPSSALLEVLDPQLNSSFMDHYLEVEYDLSNVLFICTANVAHMIPPALRDRMEIINLPGYLEFEKFQIGKKFLIPKSLKENGLSKRDIQIKDCALKIIIKKYTLESGVRNLEKQINKIHRKVAKQKALKKIKRTLIVSEKNLNKYLGAAIGRFASKSNKKMSGIVNGLAWTQFGGQVLTVEVLILPGSGQISMTGQLGDVLKESAKASISYLRKHSQRYGINEHFYKENDIHIHIPEGAIPKDGPSAGITIAIALFSALKNIPVKDKYAMTGEITLKGSILPIGGLAEKIVAAQSANIENVIIPYDNKAQYMELPDEVKKNTKIFFIKTVDDAINILFNNKIYDK